MKRPLSNSTARTKNAVLFFILRIHIPLLFFCGLSILPLAAQTTSWMGVTSTDWSISSNWTNGVPTASIDAIIGDANFTGANQPDLTNSSYCKSLTIGNGSKVSSLYSDKALMVSEDIIIGANGTITSFNNTISLMGNWYNSGTYNPTHNNSRVSFTGTTQSITGATTFKVLNINTGSTTTLTSNINVTKSFLVSGTFNPGTFLVSLSGGAYFPVNSGATLMVLGSTFASNYSANPTLNALSIVDYASSAITQTVSVQSYGTLRISGGLTKTLANNLTLQSSASNVGNVIIAAGTLDLGSRTMIRGTSSIGGSITIANNATLIIGSTNTYPANFSINNLATTSTVEYNGAAQTISNQPYGNLILSGSGGTVVKTLPASTLTVSNDFTSNAGSSSSVSYTAVAPVVVNGNFTIGASTTFGGGSLSHILSGNWTNNGTFTPGTSTVTMNGTNKVIGGTSATSFNNLSISGNGITASSTNLIVTGNLSTVSPGTFVHNNGGTLTMSGSSKIISGSDINFYNLTLSGTISTTSSFLIAGNLTVSGTLNATGGTIEMYGTSKTISGAGSITFYGYRSTGTTSTTNNIAFRSDLMGLGKLSATAGTISFIGTSSYAGTHDLFNVAINGTKLQLGANSTLGIAGTFTITAGTFDITTTTPNTTSYNGTGAQSVTAATYNNLTLEGGGTKTAVGNISANNLTINSGVTFNASTFTHTINGHWTNSGTFAASTSTIQFNGSLDTKITGATTFYVLTINKNTSVNSVTLLNPVSVATINMTSGELHTGSHAVTITTNRTGNGIITGTITRTHTYSMGVAYAFESPYNTITFSSILGSVSSITISVHPASEDAYPFDGGINRIYNISMVSTGAYTSALRLHYDDTELNGNTEAGLELWRYTSSWTKSGKLSNDVTNNWVDIMSLTDISGRWTLSNNNTIAVWKGATSSAWETASNWKSGSVPDSDNVIQIGKETFTNQPAINSPIAARTITFGSTQSATLVLNSSGSLAISGNIRGDWNSDASHTINIGSRTMTIGGDLLLNSGTSRVINISIGSGSLTINGSLTQSAGSGITFSGGGSLVIGGNYNYSGGTFSAGSGTVSYTGTTSQTLAGVTYNNLSLGKTSGTASISSSLTVNGSLTLSTGGALDINSDLTVAGNITIGSGVTVNENGAVISVGGDWNRAGSFNPTTGTLLFNGSGNQSISSGTVNKLTVNKTSGTLSLAGNLVINGNLTITAGTIDLGTYTANRSIMGGTLTLGSSSILKVAGASNFPSNFNTRSISGSSTVEFNGTMSQNIDQIGYGNLVLSNGGGTAKSILGSTTIAGDLTINNGAVMNANSYTLTLQGNLVNGGSFIPSTGSVVLAGSSKMITGSTDFNNLIVTGSYSSAEGTDLNIQGNIDLSGSYSTGTNDITTAGDVTISGSYSSDGITTYMGSRLQTVHLTGSFLSPLAQGQVFFDGTIAPMLNSTSVPTFINLTIRNTSMIRPSVGWIVVDEFTIDPGSTFDGGSLTHTFFGPVHNNGSIISSGVLYFNPAPPYTTASSVELNLGSGSSFESTGTVIFGGSRQIDITSVPSSFNNIIISNTNSAGISPTSDWTVSGDFEVTAGAYFHAGNNVTHTFNKDLTLSGTFYGDSSSVILNPTDSASAITGAGDITFHHLTIDGNVSAATDFNISGNFINHGILDPTETNITFVGGLPSQIGGLSTSTSFYHLIINKSSSTVSLEAELNGLVSLAITGGTLDDSGYSISENLAGGTLLIADGAKLKIDSVHTLPVFSNGYSFSSLSTVEYSGSNQTISPQQYGNLTLSDVGTKTLSEGITQVTTLTNNSTLVQPDVATLKLRGDWINNGIFTANTSTLEFNGTATQSMEGDSLTTFHNINVSNTANPGVSVQRNQKLKGVLQLSSNVNFDADGSEETAIFTLLSTSDSPTQDAAIGVLPSGAQVSGKVTVQRFMAIEGPKKAKIYRYISSPVLNGTVADLQMEIPVSGKFIGKNGNAASLFDYDERVITDTNKDKVNNLADGYVQFPRAANTETFSQGRGYALFVRGDLLTTARWDLRGSINAGNVAPISLPVTYTSSGNNDYDGWNLVGNPFPSSIDWSSSSGWTKSYIEETIYVRDNGNNPQRFAVWNGLIGINGGSRYIATGQAFWVKATGSGTPNLQANELVKASGTQTTFFRTSEETITNLLRIKMVKGTITDETAIHFREGATEKFDSNADARKIAGSSFNLSSVLADNTRLAINSLPAFSCLSSVKLAIDNVTNGNYRFDFSDMQTFSTSVVITLKDKFTNKTFNISGGGSYTFTVTTTNAASYGINRFEIIFSAPGAKSDFIVSASPQCEGIDAAIQISNSQVGAVYSALQSGIVISGTVTGNGGIITVIVPKSKLKSGINTISVIATIESCSVGIEKTVDVIVESTLEVVSIKNGLRCGDGSVTLSASGAPQDLQYNWYESATAPSPLPGQHTSIFNTPYLSGSTTYYVTIFNALGCEGSRKAVKADVVQSIVATISQTGGTLISNFTEGNQWYLNNEILPGATTQSIQVNQNGLYRVTASLNSCIASAEYEFIVAAAEEEVTNRNSVSVYPNPVVDKLNINISDSDQNTVVVKLFNSLGQLIAVTTTQGNQDQRCEFDMRDLPSGVYIIRSTGISLIKDIKVIKN